MVATVAAEYLLRFGAHALAVIDDMEMRLDFSEKSQRFTVGSPIAPELSMT
jgi:hypothetical protein